MGQGRKMGRVVRLPLVERFTVIGHELKARTATLMEVNGNGLFVYHKKDHIPTPEEVRRHLVGLKRTQCHIEEPTLGKAINRFFNERQGVTTGKKAKALQLDGGADARFEVYPECKHMYATEKETPVCGKLQTDGINGEFGGCVLEGSDPPGFPCPIKKFWLMKRAGTEL